MQLELKNIHKSFGKNEIFHQLDFDFSTCGFYLVTGKSGSGKSTFLNILAGYEPYDIGERYIDEHVSMACIFQSYELIEELTVKENIQMMYKESDTNKQLIKKLGMENLLDHYPKELSTGQRQRVGIARALSCHPQVILCDEPTESLDIDNKEIVLGLLKEFSKDHVVIVVSHEKELLETYCDYHYELEDKTMVLKYTKDKKEVLKEKISKEEINDASIHTMMHKIFDKKTIIQAAIMTVLIIFQLFLFPVSTSLFTDSNDYQAVNRNSIYIKTYGRDFNFHSYCETYRPILEFDSVPIKNKLYKFNVYPQSSDDVLSQTTLKANEVLINQNVANLLMTQWEISETELINHELKFTYQLSNMQYPFDAIIKGIVQEEVEGLNQIYYNYEEMMMLLKEKEFDSKEYLTQYDYFIQNNDYYELQCIENVKECFTSLTEINNVSLQHCVLSSQLQEEGQKYLYQFLFSVIQGILGLITVLYILSITWKETTKNLMNLSIIHAAGAAMDKVKHAYLIIKLRHILPFFILCIIICILLHATIFMIGYVLGCYSLYIVVLVIKVTYLHEKHISILLKDSKDE